MTLTIGSLFSGYGGLDMAVEQVTGATPVWFVEYDAAPSKILAHHWPDVPNHGDVTTVDWATMPPVDILTGGYPCQPFSQAGQRKGTNDDRHLWPYVREAIRHLRPRLVVLENVAGHRSLGFDRVLGDMAEDGLHVRWTSIRASDVGAPHHRERLFIVASPTDSEGVGWGEGAEQPIAGAPKVTATVSSDAPAADTDRRESGERSNPHEVGRRSGIAEQTRVGNSDSDRRTLHPERHAGIPDANGIGWRGEQVGVTECGQAANPHADGQGTRGAEPQRPGNADTDCERCDGRGTAPTDRHRSGIDWGPYAPAVRHWERLTRPAPAPTEPNTKGNPRLAAPFAEWLMGLPAGHVTQVPGISRGDQLKAIGNGVCPQQAAAALTQLLTSPATAGLFS